MQEAVPEPTPDELARAKRIAWRLRLVIYGALLVLAAVAVAVRAAYETDDAPAAPAAFWVSGKTAQGEEISWRVVPGGRPDGLSYSFRSSCTFGGGLLPRSELPDASQRFSWRGAQLEVTAQATGRVGAFAVDRTTRVSAELTGDDLAGTLSVHERWSLDGLPAGTCAAGPTAFRLTLKRRGP